MQRPKPVMHTERRQDGAMGRNAARRDERASMKGEGNETNDNVLESNEQREQDGNERERERGRE